MPIGQIARPDTAAISTAERQSTSNDTSSVSDRYHPELGCRRPSRQRELHQIRPDTPTRI